MNRPNAAQAAYWNDEAGPAWVAVQEPLDRQLAPLGQAAMAALAPRAGERILDIGCGSGQISLELAGLVGSGGKVVGIDLSAPLLELARRRAAGLDRLSFVRGDAQVFPFEAKSFDAAFSRFGVMFFDDPDAAFRNIGRALRPGGRLAFVCWRAWEENPIFSLPMLAAAPHLPPLAPAAEPQAPGPFAFADEGRVRGILSASGYEGIEVTPHDQPVASGDLETALALSLRVGSLGIVLRENPSMREVVAPSVRAALAAHDGPDGITLNAAVWIVTARSPG